MSNPSPACNVNGSTPPQDVAASATVTIGLVTPIGANYWFLQAVYADDLTNVSTINASLVINQTSKTATFTAPSAAARGVIFMSTVGVSPGSAIGSGLDANFQVQPSFTTTFKVNVPTSAGTHVVCTNETFEQGSAGWVTEINAVIRGAVPGTQSSWTVSDWYIDPVSGNDANAGTTTGAPVKTVMGGIVSKWGTTSPILPQTTTLHLRNTQSVGQEAIFLNPVMVGNGPSNFIIDGTSGMSQIAGSPFNCGAVTAKSRGNPGTLLQVAGFPAAATAGMLVLNTTRNAYAFIDSMSGTTATLTQPLDSTTLTTPNGVPQATPIDTWTSGDHCEVFTLPVLNLRSLQPVGGDANNGAVYPVVWIQSVHVPDISGSPGFSTLNLDPTGIGLTVTNSWIDAFLNFEAAGQDIDANTYNCWLPGGVQIIFGGVTGGAVSTNNTSQAFTRLENISSLDGDVIVHGQCLIKGGGAYNIIGTAYFDGTLTIVHGGVALLETSEALTTTTVHLWGAGTLTLESPMSVVQNLSGTTWANILTMGSMAIDASTTATKYVTGTFTDGVSITAANLDSFNGLQNPRTGSRFSGT